MLLLQQEYEITLSTLQEIFYNCPKLEAYSCAHGEFKTEEESGLKAIS